MPASPRKARALPFLLPQYCKGCGRCIDACPKHLIEQDTHVNPESGLVPVLVHTDECNACGLCIQACPEPFGLHGDDVSYEWEHAAIEHGELAVQARAETPWPEPADVPSKRIALPRTEPMLMKGTNAAAVGALLAGCRHFFGYPITPSTEGAEFMAKVLPHLQGVFVQAVSEVATVNHMYGCGGAGLPCMTFTSSPGFSLMLEGISYMIGAEIPGVFVEIMRGGPGLGNIGPSQEDVSLVCRGLGHGNTQAIVLAPADPQETLDLTMLAFELTFKYRNPVVLLGDGYLGQVTGKVRLPDHMIQPGLPSWAVYGDRAHRRNLHTSIYIVESDLEKRNELLVAKYAAMTAAEQRADLYMCDDVDVLYVASNTPARMVKAAVRDLRAQGVKAGLFRPVTLWPFPIDHLAPLLPRVKRIVMVEASMGQLEDELRLAASKAGLLLPPITAVRRMGGVLPQPPEILAAGAPPTAPSGPTQVQP